MLGEYFIVLTQTERSQCYIIEAGSALFHTPPLDFDFSGSKLNKPMSDRLERVFALCGDSRKVVVLASPNERCS